MKEIREYIRKILDKSTAPALLWSGGKDSQLLLSLIREVKNIPVILFHQGLSSFQKQIIVDFDLEVWSWMPSDVYVLPNENGLSLVREQPFGESRFPVVLDIEEGQKCIGDFLLERTPQLFPHFDALFIGYKDSDYHWTLGGSGFCPEDGWELGKAKVFAPLRHLTDSQVWQSIKEMDVPYDKERYEGTAPDPDTLQACSLCLQEGSAQVFCPKEQKMIPVVSWQPQERLKEFRQRFGLKEAA